MNGAKALYHRLVPAAVRNPIGALRRGAADRIRRAREPYPLPPAGLLRNVQLTPYVKEYLEVGRASAASIVSALTPIAPRRVLDFGCGSGRTLRHLRASGWQLFGCDVDAPAIAWCRDALPFASFAVNDADPPLPYDDALFDAVYAVSVFTHFPPGAQERWAAEMARIVRTGGRLVISTAGTHALRAFAYSDDRAAVLETMGMLFVPADGGFNANGMFHTGGGIERLFAPHFRVVMHAPRGLDGFQDLTILERSTPQQIPAK